MPFYYPNFQNDMWRIFGLAFFNDRDYFVSKQEKTFKETQIRHFLTSQGIALYDTATEVIRQKGNASDQYLQIVRPLDLSTLLSRIPACETIATTGRKATETLLAILGITQIPPLCGSTQTLFMHRHLTCYRMPSSSRAYPRPLPDKAEDYKKMFQAAGLL
jgi:G:T/U-mismatch repair DNA glycosylase